MIIREEMAARAEKRKSASLKAKQKVMATARALKPEPEKKMTTVEFEYEIGAPVRIKAIDMNGKVDSLSLDNNGKMYRVVYWSNCTRNQVWMYEWELESCK